MSELCDYGCGQEATHQLKNGKWCCSKSHNICPANKQKNREKKIGKHQGPLSEEHRKKIGEAHIGITHSEETKKKMSKSRKGKKLGPHSEETKKKIGKGNKGKIRSEETKKKLSEANKGKTLSEEHKKKLSEAKKFSLKNYQEKHSFFCKIEELRETKNGDIQGHCKNHDCENSKEKGGWFILTTKQIIYRRNSLEYEDGNDGSYFYCCQECKDACPLYRLHGDPLKDNIKPYTYQEYQTFRITVLERDNYICQFCGKPATIVHHKRPQKLEPFYALDPDYAISVCRDCHHKKGHPKGTPHSTGNLAKVICSVESQEVLNKKRDK